MLDYVLWLYYISFILLYASDGVLRTKFLTVLSDVLFGVDTLRYGVACGGFSALWKFVNNGLRCYRKVEYGNRVNGAIAGRSILSFHSLFNLLTVTVLSYISFIFLLCTLLHLFYLFYTCLLTFKVLLRRCHCLLFRKAFDLHSPFRCSFALFNCSMFITSLAVVCIGLTAMPFCLPLHALKLWYHLTLFQILPDDYLNLI